MERLRKLLDLSVLCEEAATIIIVV